MRSRAVIYRKVQSHLDGKMIRGIVKVNRGALVRVIPFCGDCPGPRFEDKFRSANQMYGISIANGGKMADS